MAVYVRTCNLLEVDGIQESAENKIELLPVDILGVPDIQNLRKVMCNDTHFEYSNAIKTCHGIIYTCTQTNFYKGPSCADSSYFMYR